MNNDDSMTLEFNVPDVQLPPEKETYGIDNESTKVGKGITFDISEDSSSNEEETLPTTTDGKILLKIKKIAQERPSRDISPKKSFKSWNNTLKV